MLRPGGIFVLFVFSVLSCAAHAADAPTQQPTRIGEPATEPDKLPKELVFEIWARPSGQNNWDHRISSGGRLEYEIGNRSWHALFIRPLFSQQVSLGVRTTCDSDGAGQTEAIDWMCPAQVNLPQSKYIRRVKFVLIGNDRDKYQLSYSCRTDRYQGPGGAIPRLTKDYPEVAEDQWCGPEDATNIWLSKLAISIKRK